jgi:hypothetical protein
MPGPPWGSRHNWLLDNMLEKIPPNVGSHERVAFRHTPHKKSSASWTDRWGFTKQKPGEPRTVSTWHPGGLFEIELVYTETQRALLHPECAHWPHTCSTAPLVAPPAKSVATKHENRK